MITVTLILLMIANSISAKAPKVQVEQGVLAGEMLDLVTGEGQYYSFKGIRYGRPPIGELRFRAPLAATAWKGVKNATAHGSVCPQIDIFTGAYIEGSEDCLFLNVYSPNLRPRTLLSVLVFIHGGGWECGSGDVDVYGPDFFLRKNIVLVTLNYRLDALGFLSLGTEEVPGNAGMKDQVLALKWVQKNIHAFGGDPSKVTIMGESAGAASVGYHMASPMSTGLFYRGIALSGSPFTDWAMAYQPEMRAFKLGKQLGLETQDTDTLLAFLRNVTSEQLVKYTDPHVIASEQTTGVLSKQFQFIPVVEKFSGANNFLSENLFDGKFSHVNKADVMFGYTSEEGLTVLLHIINRYFPAYDGFVETFAPRKISQAFGPDKVLEVGANVRNHYLGNKSVNIDALREFLSYVNDAHFKYDSIRYYEQFPSGGTKYMYQFSSISSRNQFGNQGVAYRISGVGHFDDVGILFDPKARSLTLDINSEDFQIIDRFTTLLVNFIENGNPTPDSSFSVTWPEFDSTSKKYMDIGTSDLTVLSLNDETFYDYWSNLFESAGVSY